MFEQKKECYYLLEEFKFRLAIELNIDRLTVHKATTSKIDFLCMLDMMMRYGLCHWRNVKIAQIVAH